MKPRVPAAAKAILEPMASLAQELDLPLYAVGGCVRDWIIRRPSLDLDLVCEGDPTPLASACAQLLGGRAEAFGQFGTLRILSSSRLRVDFATSRREIYPEPASLPVVEPAPLLEDLKRRDFTVNAMAMALTGPDAGELVDPLGGHADLEAGRLRLLHVLSLRDDPTRAFRAARYACRLGLTPDADLERQAREAVAKGHAGRLSPHRLTQELLRLLAEDSVDCSFRRLRRWGYLGLLGDDLKAPPERFKSVEERLGALALELGPSKGERFVNALALDRKLSAELHGVLKLAEERRSPKGEISSAARRLLRWAAPGLAQAALKPLFIGGDDLKALGLAPGQAYREILDEASALQWRGKLKTRAQALSWLKLKAAGR